MKRYGLAFLAMGFMMAAPAWSAEPDYAQQFARLDANGDGKVTWSEAYAVRAGEFIAMDRNLDGVIDVTEFQVAKVSFEQFDANGDGRLELSEYVGLHRRSFGMADTDGDGNLTLQEYVNAQVARGKQSR